MPNKRIRRDVLGFPGYQVDAQANVFYHNELLRQYWTTDGYVLVQDKRKGKNSVKRSWLICIAFHGEKPFPKAQVAHNNGHPSDDRPENLRWSTASANVRDIKKHNPSWRVGEDNGRCKITDNQVREIRKLYSEKWGTQQQIAEKFGIDQTQVSRIILWKQRL